MSPKQRITPAPNIVLTDEADRLIAAFVARKFSQVEQLRYRLFDTDAPDANVTFANDITGEELGNLPLAALRLACRERPDSTVVNVLTMIEAKAR